MESHSVAAPEIAAWIEAGGTPDAEPPLSPATVLDVALRAGIQIASTGTPALDGTYSLDPVSRANIAAIYAGIKGGDGLPGGGASFVYTDPLGSHTFTATAF